MRIYETISVHSNPPLPPCTDLKALEQFRAREGWKGVPSYVQAPAAAVRGA